MADPLVHTVLNDALMRLFTDAPQRLDINARTVTDLIDGLEARYPGMGHCLRDSQPAIRRHINIFVRGERAELATPLDGSEPVYIFTAISGG